MENKILLEILKRPSYSCLWLTEPIAVALAVAKAKEVLGNPLTCWK